MNNKQLYTISNQQRFTLNSWQVIVPYSHVHFPVYLTNPYQLTYRKAGYIRAHSYNYSIGQQTFTFDMGVHVNATLPNVGLYNQQHTLGWSRSWSAYPSMDAKVMYENHYTNCNLPYLPASKYGTYNNSGNRSFYDVMVHTLYRRYYTATAKSYVTTGLDSIISTYNPLTAAILSHPSCIYYLLSPQLYPTWLFTHRGQIKTPLIYLRSLLHDYVYIHMWSMNFAQLWLTLCDTLQGKNLHFSKCHRGVHFAAVAKVDSLLCYKYAAHISGIAFAGITHNHPVTMYNQPILRVGITHALTFVSSLQMSIPAKKLSAMGSWGVNYLEYYTPRITATMHGTGITSKLPLRKYHRVTGGQGGRLLGLRVYKSLVVLPATLQAQSYVFSYARILHSITAVSDHCGSSLCSHYFQLYAHMPSHIASVMSLWTHVWVRLYKHGLVKHSRIRITRKYAQPKYVTQQGGITYHLPHVRKLWYNRMLAKKTNSK